MLLAIRLMSSSFILMCKYWQRGMKKEFERILLLIRPVKGMEFEPW